jgi:hypothetical protein
MFWIMENARVRIAENALRLFKPNSTPGSIEPVFSLSPNRTATYLDNI